METPLEKAIRLAKEKEQSEVASKPEMKAYKDMSYEDYLAQKGGPKKKSPASSSVSQNGSKTSGQPSTTSQETNPFEVKFDNAQTQEQFIGEENAQRIKTDSANTNPLKLDVSAADTSKIPYAGINPNEINRMNPEQVALEEAKRRNGSESSYGNLAGNFLAEAAKTVTNDIGNITKTISNQIGNNRNEYNKLNTVEKLKVIEEQNNPFIRLKNLFSAITETVYNPEEGLAGNYARSFSNALPAIRNVITPGNVYQQWDNMISNMSPDQKQKAIANLTAIKSVTDQASQNISDWQSNNPVPKNIFTSTPKAIGQMAPDIALMMLTEGGSSEVTAAKYANMFAAKSMPSVINKYAPRAAAFIERGIKSSATKVFAAKGAIEAGANNESIAEGTLKGAATGVYMHSLGELAGVVAKPIAKTLSKTGLPSEYSQLFAIPTANAATFAGAKAVTTPLIEDRFATKDELYQELGVGIAMSSMGLRNTFEKHRDMNKLAKDVLVNDPVVGLKDILRTPNEKILEDFDPQMDVVSMTKARDELRKSIIVEPEPSVKQELMTEAAILQKKLDSRIALEELLTNKENVKEAFSKTDFLNPEQKQRINERIDDINNSFKNAENEAKAQEAGEKVEIGISKVDKLAEDMIDVETPEQLAKVRKEAVDSAKDIVDNQVTLEEITSSKVESPKVGDKISFGENKTGFIKDLLQDNKALVGVNVDGIYSERTIDLKTGKEAEQSKGSVGKLINQNGSEKQFEIVDKNGEIVGEFIVGKIDGIDNVVSGTSVKEDRRNQGIATDTYLDYINKFGELWSGRFEDVNEESDYISDEAKGVWRKLEKYGAKIEKINNTEYRYHITKEDLLKSNEKAITETKPQDIEKQNSQIGTEATENNQAIETTGKSETGTSGNAIPAIEIPEEFRNKSAEELASSYMEEVNNPSITSIEEAIYSMPFSTSRDSYAMFGDRNNITASKARSYFKKDGLSLDVLAKEINDTKFDGNEVVTPQDLVDFIDRYPNGVNTVVQPSGNPRLRNINNAYFEQTGKRLNQKTAADIVLKQTESLNEKPNEEFEKIDEDSIRIIEEEGVTLDNIDSLSYAIRFIYGDQAFDDLKAYLIFGPSKISNDTREKTSENNGFTPEISAANSGSSELEGIAELRSDGLSSGSAEPISGEIPVGASSGKLGEGNELYLAKQRIGNRLGEGIREAEAQLGKPLDRFQLEDLEKSIVLTYAKENGLWIEDFYSLGDRTLQGGNENILTVKESTKELFKSNNLLNSKNSVNNLLESIENHNTLFPETKYELVGFTGLDNPKRPYIEVILKQDYIPDASQANPQEINDYMTSLNFEKVNEHTFKNNELVVSDLRPRNVLKDVDGTIYVIDNIIRRNEKAQEENTEPNGKVQSRIDGSQNSGEDNSFQSAPDAEPSDSQTKITSAQAIVDNKTKEVSQIQNELSKLGKSLSKNLSENQQDMFGKNQTQSLFDDKANQQKIYQDKSNQLAKAQQDLATAKNDISSLKESIGQVSLDMPDPIIEIEGDKVDLSKSNEDDDAKIIAKSFLNPLELISKAQKGVDRLENKYTERLANRVSDWVAENFKSWRTSKSTLKQVASSYATSIMGGIARTNADANAKLGLIGGKNMAVYNMAKVMKAAYEIVDNNTESLERVHVVMDPDFYQIGLGGQPSAFKPNVPPNLQYTDLTIQEQQLHDELRKMLDDIHFKNYALGFISKDTFDKYKGTYVPRMYETFELPKEVQEVLDTYHGQIGDKLNLNPFKKRKGLDNLSQESKDAVLKDPVYLVAKRQMELDTNSAIMTYINHINRNNRSIVHQGDDNVPFNYEKLEGKAYGALDGKYVPSYLAEDLRGYFFVNKGLNNIYDTIKAYDRTWARKGIKKGLTVFNPFVQIGNFTSNVVFAQMAGVDFVRWFGNTPSAIKELKDKGTDYEDLLAAGLIGTDVVVSELMPNTERANSLLQQAEAKKSQGPMGKILSGLKSIDDKLLALYSGNDDYAKINAYQIFKKQGYSKEEAIKKVYDGFQNYATVGKFWDVTAKTPVIGNPFQKFSADLMRITANAVTKKPLSTSIYLAALYFMPGLILNAIGWDEDETDLEKELRESRPFIPKMDLGAVNIPLVYKTKYGELNLARYITPYFYFDNGEDGALGSMTERFSPIKTVATQGYGKGNERDVLFGQDPILGTLYNALITDTDFRGKSISDPEASRYRASGITDGEKWKNITANAARTWVPNGGLLHDTYLNAKYGEDYYGRTRNMTQALINFAVKIQRFEDGDYKKTAEKQLYSLASELKGSAETIKNAMVLNQRQRQKTERDYKEGKKTLADYQNSLEKLDGTLKSRLKELNKQLEDNQNKFIDFRKKYEPILNR